MRSSESQRKSVGVGEEKAKEQGIESSIGETVRSIPRRNAAVND